MCPILMTNLYICGMETDFKELMKQTVCFTVLFFLAVLVFMLLMYGTVSFFMWLGN